MGLVMTPRAIPLSGSELRSLFVYTWYLLVSHKQGAGGGGKFYIRQNLHLDL